MKKVFIAVASMFLFALLSSRFLPASACIKSNCGVQGGFANSLGVYTYKPCPPHRRGPKHSDEEEIQVDPQPKKSKVSKDQERSEEDAESKPAQ